MVEPVRPHGPSLSDELLRQLEVKLRGGDILTSGGCDVWWDGDDLRLDIDVGQDVVPCARLGPNLLSFLRALLDSEPTP